MTELFAMKLLAADGMLIIEHSKFTKMDHLPHFSFDKHYGGTVFTFYEYEGEEEEDEDDDQEAE